MDDPDAQAGVQLNVRAATLITHRLQRIVGYASQQHAALTAGRSGDVKRQLNPQLNPHRSQLNPMHFIKSSNPLTTSRDSMTEPSV